jgi:hypothetical protein
MIYIWVGTETVSVIFACIMAASGDYERAIFLEAIAIYSAIKGRYQKEDVNND